MPAIRLNKPQLFRMKISKVVIVINRTKPHAKKTAAALKAALDHEGVKHEWVETLPPQRNLYRRLADVRDKRADLVIACGGDGTLLQAAHRFRGLGFPFWESTSATWVSSPPSGATGFKRRSDACLTRNSSSVCARRSIW